jgi:hypothetical protein
MLHSIGRTAVAQVQSLLCGFLQDGTSPFSSVLTMHDIGDLSGFGSAFDKTDHAEGRAALQDARDGAEGDLGPSAGLQPAPCGHGPSRSETQDGPTPGELAKGPPDADGLAQPVGAGVPEPTRGDHPDCAQRDRQSSRGNPAGPLRAALVQATPQAVSPLESTAAASSRTLGNSRLRPRKRHSSQMGKRGEVNTTEVIICYRRSSGSASLLYCTSI